MQPGSIHGVAGENGAGKSTLMKIIAGVHAGDSGEMRVDGAPVRFRSTRDARAAGIGMVHQELSVAPDADGRRERVPGFAAGRRARTDRVEAGWRAEAAAQLKNLGLDDRPPRPARRLSRIGVQQLVELARVLFSGARIIILDEPTSALSHPEIERLFQAVLRKVRDGGCSLMFISHFLDDILAKSATRFRSFATGPASQRPRSGPPSTRAGSSSA